MAKDKKSKKDKKDKKDKAEKPAKAGYDLAMERLGDAIESLDEAQALLGDDTETSDFLVGIIFASQTSLRLVAQMAKEFQKEAKHAAKHGKAGKRG